MRAFGRCKGRVRHRETSSSIVLVELDEQRRNWCEQRLAKDVARLRCGLHSSVRHSVNVLALLLLIIIRGLFPNFPSSSIVTSSRLAYFTSWNLSGLRCRFCSGWVVQSSSSRLFSLSTQPLLSRRLLHSFSIHTLDTLKYSTRYFVSLKWVQVKL